MGQILLVRHGQASFGAADYDQLSEFGTQQSRLLGEWFTLCGQQVDQVWTGSLRRHRQTADACLAAINGAAPPSEQWHLDAGLDEFDHKDVIMQFRQSSIDAERCTSAVHEAEDPRRAFEEMFSQATARWMGGSYDDQYRESWPAFRQRCADAMRQLLEASLVSSSSVVFTSGGVISAMCQHLLRISDEQARRVNWTLVNSGVTRIVYSHASNRTTLVTLNSYPHIECTGRRDLITYR